MKRALSTMAGLAMPLLLLVLALGAANASGTGELVTEASGPFPDPCTAIMAPSSAATHGTADPLSEAGMVVLAVPRSLVNAFTPTSLTCLSRATPEGTFVRGVFVELSDEVGTVAIYASLSPSDAVSSDEWQEYLRETFADEELRFESSAPGSLMAVVVDHPRADRATAAMSAGGEEVSLWATVKDVVAP